MMNIGFVGLGAVVETAWLPALKRLSLPMTSCWGYDSNPQRMLPGVTRCESLQALLAHPLDTLCITTTSLQHLPVLEAALASTVPRIVVEKPVAATLAQLTHLRELLNLPEHAQRVLALDHWMARDGALCLALGNMDTRWRPEHSKEAAPVTISVDDIRASCWNLAGLTVQVNRLPLILPPANRIPASYATRMALFLILEHTYWR